VSQERIEALANRLETGILSLQSVAGRGVYGGAANINVNAGGMGLWIACSCCAVMLAVVFIGGLWMVSDRAEARAQIRELRDGQNAIRAYINTGILKPQNDKDKSDAE
jgi:hypothetical protein